MAYQSLARSCLISGLVRMMERATDLIEPPLIESVCLAVLVRRGLAGDLAGFRYRPGAGRLPLALARASCGAGKTGESDEPACPPAAGP